MQRTAAADVVVIGAGIAGIAVAYYLTRDDPDCKVTLIDALAPMSLTSAQSGENYRNWWPSRIMTGFVDHSIDLLQQIVRDSGDRIRLTQRGYALATRHENIDAHLRGLRAGYGDDAAASIRIRDHRDADAYVASLGRAADGVDVVADPELVRRAFPAFDPDVRHVIHIRRAGDLDGYQLGQFLLEKVRAGGGKLIRGEVGGIEKPACFRVTLADHRVFEAPRLVVAAGPFVNRLLENLGERLPVLNVLQQKLAFEDVLQSLPRNQPFAVDLDRQALDWTAEERALLADDAVGRSLLDMLPGNVHRRPDGGDHRRWLRLGWACNKEPADPSWSPVLDDHFPEIVLRAAARLNPALKDYYGRLPAARHHYGGYYTMTRENLPIIGPLETAGAFVVAALSGFGTMAACAAGECCARWVTGGNLPDYARPLSLQRFSDANFMTELTLSNDRGVL